MEQQQTSPQPPATLPIIRHDGWTGEKIATFCETLAETAVVAEACEAARMGISGAYAARRRNPVFAAAWDAALSIARERLADTLLARSMEGNVVQIWSGGEIVGERHALDNRLGLAILRRLDRLAETGLSTSSRGVRAATAPAPSKQALDWNLAVDALRAGDDEAVAKALALAESHEVEEVEGPPNSLIRGEEDGGLDLSSRCWFDQSEDQWFTDFPPPTGFSGYQEGEYGDVAYMRVCADEEVAILEASAAADGVVARTEDEILRDEWFAFLRAECSESEDTPGGTRPD